MTRPRWILLAAILASGIVFLDSTVVNVALPRIGRDLPSHVFSTLEAQSYVYNGYLLSLSALLILAGALNDHHGRRRTFGIGMVGFTLTSVLCGLAPNMETLIVMRVLQGAAGAILVPGSLAVITTNFEGEAQGRAFGVWAGASSLTTLLGPFVGGLLVDTVSWRAAFLMNLPLALPALYAIYRHVPESRDESSSGRFDYRGAAVVAMAVGGLSFGGIYGQQHEWRDPLAFVALGAGAVALAGLPFLMMRTPNPLIPLGLFRSRAFSVVNISTFLIYGALYVSGYYLTLFMQGVAGYTAAAAGLGFVPTGILLALLSRRFGTLAGRHGPRWFMTAGPLLMAAGVMWYARIPAATAGWKLDPGHPATWIPSSGYLLDVLPGSLGFGFGLAMLVAPLTAALMASVPERNAGVGSAINNAISRVGPQLAGAAIFVAITALFYGEVGALTGHQLAGAERTQVSPLSPSTPVAFAAAVHAASVDAFHLAMVLSAALLAAGAAVNALGIRNARAGEKAGTALEVPAAG